VGDRLRITLEDFCDMIVDVNVKIIKDSSTKSTIFTIVTLKNDEPTFHPFFHTDGSPMDYAQQIIDKESPDMYCIVSEAWVRMMPIKESDEYEKNYKWGDMKKDPKKKEALFFLGKTKDGTKNYNRIFIIHRKKSETTLEELKDSGGVTPTLQSSKLT